MQNPPQGARQHGRSDAVSLPGPRERNEDAWLADDELGVFVLADGMGGYDEGQLAATLAVEAARAYLRDTLGRTGVDADQAVTLVDEAIQVANAAVLAARTGPRLHRPMGTTLVVALLAGDGVAIAHAGDSRAYLVRRGRGVRLTRDHNVLEDPPFGSWSSRVEDPESLRHLTRCIGFRPAVSSESRFFALVPGDLIVLCTDGFWEHLDANDFALLGLGAPLPVLGRRIEERGLTDNATALAFDRSCADSQRPSRQAGAGGSDSGGDR